MKAFAVLLLVGIAAAVPISEKNVRFSIWGSPIVDPLHPASANLAIVEKAASWKNLYEKPFYLAAKLNDEPELKAFLVPSGLSGVDLSPDTRALHDLLWNGPPKAGVLLSGAKSLAIPEIKQSISAVHLPKSFTLTHIALLESEYGSPLPTVLVAPESYLKAAGIDKLNKVADFTVTEQYITVPENVRSPVAIPEKN